MTRVHRRPNNERKIQTMKNQNILRNRFISVCVLFALTQSLTAGTRAAVLYSSERPLIPSHPTYAVFDAPDSTFTVPSAITATGVIIGSYVDANGVTHGFLRSRGGNFTTFDVPDSTSTTPTDINPAGVITGWYNDTFGNLHGFIRARDGSITSFDAPPGFDILGSPYGPGAPPPSINPSGTIAGMYGAAFPNFVTHGFLRSSDGKLTTVDFPGASNTEVLAINPAGVIVGDFSDAVSGYQGFLRTPDGTFTVIGPPGAQTIPAGINPAGAIAGGFSDGGTNHGYLRNPDGAFMTFDAPGSIYTSPTAINTAGAITGFYSDADGVLHGFVRAGNGAIVTLDPPDSVSTFPVAINARGVITGVFMDSDGIGRAFVRMP